GSVSYSYALLDSETHASGLGENSLFDNLAVVVTDADGSTDSDTLSIRVVDDVPRAFAPVEALLVDQVPTSHTVTASLNFAGAAGADGVGTVIFSNFTEGDIATDADVQPLFFNGEQLYLYYGTDQTQLVAKTADNDIGYTIDIDPLSDTYTVTTHGVISNGVAEVTTTNLSGVGAGNVNFKGLIDIGGTTQDALISSTTGSINSDIDDIGIGSQWISTAENVRFDFVNGLAAGGANGTGFVYSDHNTVFGFRQKVYVQGGKTNTANLIVTAIIANNDYVFGNTDGGETQVDLSIGDIKVFDGAVDVTGLVTLVDNGTSITIEGMHNGWVFQIASDTAFSAVYVEGAVDTDEFSLGFFTYTQTVPGQPIDLSHAITATDGDGDAVSSAINATLYPAATSVEGDSGDNVINGTAGVDHLFGYEGNDTLNGLLGDDVLSGGDGDDILVGGLGNDLMSGGAGSDIFKWLAGESGTDTITDFVKGFNSGGDQLDLSELLVGEHGAPGDLGNLLSYIDIAISGLDTVLNVSSTAVADPAVAPEQTIVLQNVDLYASYGMGNEADLMLSMLGDGTLKVDTV
ncbi:MAG: type I secretion C-terminal target domain-containing protein, partial [Pseudomonas sp.]|nr:type I secretion C-terminal target domain-containing protein [Pseudomonas sp.]